ncbi:MAG: hypothetical protein OER88_11755 [Planctomycetota bacterium]|nr:hypothetical protein [Planctomycetota bacterium]
MRWPLLFVLAFPTLAFADPFALAPGLQFGEEGVPGAAARLNETLAILRDATATNPGDAAAWTRAADILEGFGRAAELVEPLRKAHKKLQGPAQSAVGGVLGRSLAAKANAEGGGGGGFIIVIVNGQMQPQRRNVNKAAQAIYKEAIALLKESIRVQPEQIKERLVLADALEATSTGEPSKEPTKWRLEASALKMKRRGALEVPLRFTTDTRIAALLTKAQELELKTDPAHKAAGALRKEALVLSYCNYTIPFEYEPTLFETIAQLATQQDLTAKLTRHYLDRDGTQRTVPPEYHAPSWPRRIELIKTVGRSSGDTAVAALLAVLGTKYSTGELGELALDLLAKSQSATLKARLAMLLTSALLDDEPVYQHRAIVQRRLVELAARLKLKQATPTLVAAFRRQDDLITPRGIANALATIGDPFAAGVLLETARDPNRDVYYRRNAVLALGRLAPALLADLPDEPKIALAKAAARYRIQPDDANKGRILSAIGTDHETDDAAALCVALEIREAVPLLEAWLGEHTKHYAVGPVAAAVKALR